MSRGVSSSWTEAQRYVWDGAIPLQIHLHDSEVTTLPPPPPALILAPRIGYLPLLAPQIKPFFSSALPPGVDTVWFDYKGLPLKWYIPTGVLFDLLCGEPERPWNLTVHFRGYPGNILTPCDGEDTVKWGYINSLKEAAYVINGNCKNVMNMSQSDQVDLWHSVVNGNLEAYIPISSKLKFRTTIDELSVISRSSSLKSRQSVSESDTVAPLRAGRIPVRLYLWVDNEDFDGLEDLPHFGTWDKISYINRPVEIASEGKCFTLHDAVKSLLPEYFSNSSASVDVSGEVDSEETGKTRCTMDVLETLEKQSDHAEIKLVRIQGIEPKMEIPFAWVVNNLINPDHFLHIVVYLRVSQLLAI